MLRLKSHARVERGTFFAPNQTHIFELMSDDWPMTTTGMTDVSM